MANQYYNFSFDVKINGENILCDEVLNLSFSSQPVEGAPVDEAQVKDVFENVILKRNITKGDNLFFDLWNSRRISHGPQQPIQLIIQLLDDVGAAVVVWSFFDVFPVRVSFSDFDSQGNAIAKESLELSFGIINVDYIKENNSN
ncbi:phage tail protein [Lewinella cohaerens]|uniref:phage tail protein n=1 Tax=Lewinella cohaerens TaxID=70995 RepID=UPI00036861FD|nr:phage tail protein [Lewinella cohaerens]